MTEQQLLLNACNIITNFIKEEFIKQGHTLTQEWEDSVVYKDEGEGVGIYATGYGMIVDAGVTADRIPYGGTGTGNGTSKYIEGLARYWKLRRPELSGKQALRLAFVTAEVQSKEGMSTVASSVYSSTGLRQHFMEVVELLVSRDIDNFIFEGLDLMIEQQANEPKIMYM